MSGKKLRLVLWGLVAINLVALLWIGVVAPKMNADAIATVGQGDYALQVTDGTTFTEATLKDGPSMVFFGFTHCPDVCPTTLGDVLTWQEDVEGADALKVYFVTVDPARDTADILKEYVEWVPGVVGVTGSQAEIDKAISAFKAFAAKVPLEGDDYTMDHSASVLLFDREGHYSDRIRYQEDAAVAAEKIRTLFAS